MRKSYSAITLAFLLFFCAATPTAKADGSASVTKIQLPDASHADPFPSDQQFPNQDNPKSAAELKVEKQLEKERQKQRWQEIKRRSEQLLEVATELKQYVDKSGENVLSVEVIKKAEQMEKLSKDLQKKMKGD